MHTRSTNVSKLSISVHITNKIGNRKIKTYITNGLTRIKKASGVNKNKQIRINRKTLFFY